MLRWLKQLLSRRKEKTKTSGQTQRFPLMARDAWCSVCTKTTRFTRIWRCAQKLDSCSACGFDFEVPEMIYSRTQPACPRCEEPLEQPGFDYGLCDYCGSKFELVEGTKPGLLPNKRQRDEMRKHGRSWSLS